MGFVQKYWTPNIVGCNIRISLATGIPEYDEYVKSISWFNRSGLRYSVPDGSVAYHGGQTRQYPKAIWPQMIKLRPESAPLYPGHEEVSAYFPFGETAVTDLIEGQLAFLHHVRTYEEAHPGTRFLQRNLCWKIEFLNCCIGSLPKEQLDEISSGINDRSRPAWWLAQQLGCQKQQGHVACSSACTRSQAGQISGSIDGTAGQAHVT